MTLSVETLLVVSLLMAVFAAVSTVGTSLFLGAGFERLRAGFENIKKQTAFFSEAIHKLDGRVDVVEKQSGYFFESIHKLEQEALTQPEQAEETAKKEADPELPAADKECLLSATKDDASATKADNLLTASGFVENRPSHYH